MAQLQPVRVRLVDLLVEVGDRVEAGLHVRKGLGGLEDSLPDLVAGHHQGRGEELPDHAVRVVVHRCLRGLAGRVHLRGNRGHGGGVHPHLADVDVEAAVHYWITSGGFSKYSSSGRVSGRNSAGSSATSPVYPSGRWLFTTSSAGVSPTRPRIASTTCAPTSRCALRVTSMITRASWSGSRSRTPGRSTSPVVAPLALTRTVTSPSGDIAEPLTSRNALS